MSILGVRGNIKEKQMKKEQIKMSEKLTKREDELELKIKEAFDTANSQLPSNLKMVAIGNKIIMKRFIEVKNIADLKWLGLVVVPVGQMAFEFVGDKNQIDLVDAHEREYRINNNIIIKNYTDIKEFPIEVKVKLVNEQDLELMEVYTKGSMETIVGNVTLKWTI